MCQCWPGWDCNVQNGYLQVLWGEALMQVEEGLKAGRRWFWDEASRKVGMLLAAPAAFQGEHFLQARPLFHYIYKPLTALIELSMKNCKRRLSENVSSKI